MSNRNRSYYPSDRENRLRNRPSGYRGRQGGVKPSVNEVVSTPGDIERAMPNLPPPTDGRVTFGRFRKDVAAEMLGPCPNHVSDRIHMGLGSNFSKEAPRLKHYIPRQRDSFPNNRVRRDEGDGSFSRGRSVVISRPGSSNRPYESKRRKDCQRVGNDTCLANDGVAFTETCRRRSPIPREPPIGGNDDTVSVELQVFRKRTRAEQEDTSRRRDNTSVEIDERLQSGTAEEVARAKGDARKLKMIRDMMATTTMMSQPIMQDAIVMKNTTSYHDIHDHPLASSSTSPRGRADFPPSSPASHSSLDVYSEYGTALESLSEGGRAIAESGGRNTPESFGNTTTSNRAGYSFVEHQRIPHRLLYDGGMSPAPQSSVAQHDRPQHPVRAQPTHQPHSEKRGSLRNTYEDPYDYAPHTDPRRAYHRRPARRQQRNQYAENGEKIYYCCAMM